MIDEPAPTASSRRSAYSACERPAITSGRVTPSAASSAGSVSTTPSPNTMRRAIVSWTTLTSLRLRSRRKRAVASSAGKKDSIASSETVTSIAVPKLVAVLMNASSLPSAVSRSGTAISLTSSEAASPACAPGSAASSSCSAKSAGSPLTTA